MGRLTFHFAGACVLCSRHPRPPTAIAPSPLCLTRRHVILRTRPHGAALRYPHLRSFNGGMDVFIDVGSKQIGVEILQQLTGASGDETLHFGDQVCGPPRDLPPRASRGPRFG